MGVGGGGWWVKSGRDGAFQGRNQGHIGGGRGGSSVNHTCWNFSHFFSCPPPGSPQAYASYIVGVGLRRPIGVHGVYTEVREKISLASNRPPYHPRPVQQWF